jgi:hypothetical protein
VAVKLPNWKGRLLNKAGQLVLVYLVLSSIIVYHMTVFRLSKWALKRIDRIHRRFLWNGSDNERIGHYLVNWKRVMRPKHLGSLGVKDLHRFNTALWLQWPWQRWQDKAKPWIGMPVQLSARETELFRACTAIHQLGDGHNIKFWHDRWISGQVPKDLAPNLFRLAWWKNTSVAQAITHGHWMRGLRRISTTEEVTQFVNLWRLLTQTSLNDQPDSIVWRFSSNGK